MNECLVDRSYLQVADDLEQLWKSLSLILQKVLSSNNPLALPSGDDTADLCEWWLGTLQRLAAWRKRYKRSMSAIKMRAPDVDLEECLSARDVVGALRAMQQGGPQAAGGAAEGGSEEGGDEVDEDDEDEVGGGGGGDDEDDEEDDGDESAAEEQQGGGAVGSGGPPPAPQQQEPAPAPEADEDELDEGDEDEGDEYEEYDDEDDDDY